eukprot:SAG11_NODE_26424_length_345_cov_1.231707_1_plen_52_part_10
MLLVVVATEELPALLLMLRTKPFRPKGSGMAAATPPPPLPRDWQQRLLAKGG